ncbi:SHOCT domain-containing protein [Clostridiaceae bacterium 35-E11]
MCGYGFGYTGWGIWMFLRMGLGIVITVGLIVWMTKLLKNNGYHRKHTLEKLDEKFANGEINEQEYMQKKKILREK